MTAPRHRRRLAAAARPRAGPGAADGEPAWAMPAEKSMSFGPSARRLLGRLRPERARVLLVLLLAVVSVGLTVLGPKILGRATDIIFAGVIGQPAAAGHHQGAGRRGLRAPGKANLADMLGPDGLVPGHGIDFAALGHVLLLVARPLRRGVGVRLGAGLPAQRRRAAHRLPAARRTSRTSSTGCRCTYFDQPAARRAAQPGHQRHRQHRRRACSRR